MFAIQYDQELNVIELLLVVFVEPLGDHCRVVVVDFGGRVIAYRYELYGDRALFYVLLE